jgi:hypothetical protein
MKTKTCLRRPLRRAQLEQIRGGADSHRCKPGCNLHEPPILVIL